MFVYKEFYIYEILDIKDLSCEIKIDFSKVWL